MCYCIENLKDIPNYNKYMITSKGRVWSKYKRDWITLLFCKKGYLRVSIYNNDGKRKTIRIHKLVAMTYLTNNNIIDHIDRNKTNNCVCNLRDTDLETNSFNCFKKGRILRISPNRYRFSYKFNRIYYQKFFERYEEARTYQLVYQSLQKIFKIKL